MKKSDILFKIETFRENLKCVPEQPEDRTCITIARIQDRALKFFIEKLNNLYNEIERDIE